ncbi:MAG TPA: GGDEF domain-containing protein [Vicinamibacterales bacterium]|nr:GGDEF domain-containing protein [Vicinamibacterales bacterium]
MPASLFDRAPIPIALSFNPRGAAALGALILATLLVGLFAYRRRTYILQWSSGWLLIAASLALLSREWHTLAAGRAAVGLSQLLNLSAAFVFVMSGDSFRQHQRSRIRWRDAWYFLPLVLWFAMAPIALGVRAVLVPGYLLGGGMYATAAFAYLLVLKRTRLVGAGAVGVSFLLLAAMHGWLAYDGALYVSGWNSRALTALVPSALLSIVAGLGMHILVFEDITLELRQANQRLEAAHRDLEQLVITDPLTGCYNRRFFHEIVSREVQRRQRYGTPLSVLFVDVDRFKTVNDTLGHEAGDAALQRVADFLRRNVREADFLFRWGGDEFVVLLTCEELEAASKSHELRRAFADEIKGEPYPAGFGLSIGCAELPSDSTNVLAVIKRADERMYGEKTRRRRRA